MGIQRHHIGQAFLQRARGDRYRSHSLWVERERERADYQKMENLHFFYFQRVYCWANSSDKSPPGIKKNGLTMAPKNFKIKMKIKKKKNLKGEEKQLVFQPL